MLLTKLNNFISSENVRRKAQGEQGSNIKLIGSVEFIEFVESMEFVESTWLIS